MIKCTYCGKFIEYKQLTKGEAIIDFIPDSDYSVERTHYICAECK